MAVASAGALLLEIISTTLLQRIVPDAFRGRTIGIMETRSSCCLRGGRVRAARRWPPSNPCRASVASGVIMAVAGIVARRPARPLRRPGAARSTPSRAPAGRRGAVRAACRRRAIETAMRAATVREMTAGEVIIRQGDAGGPLLRHRSRAAWRSRRSPAQAREPQVLRQMGAGEFFGEIGLLVARAAHRDCYRRDRRQAGRSAPAKPFLELVSCRVRA